MPSLDTTRLRLRAPTLDDAPSLFARYTQDPVVTHHLTWLPHDTVERTRTFVRRCLAVIEDGSAVPWVITERHDQRPIGMIELRLTGHRAELGYVMARAWLEKVGMQCEGLLRRWLVHPGLGPEPRDCWSFGRVR